MMGHRRVPRASTYHDEEEAKWEPSTGSDELALVRVVLEGVDQKDQQCTAEELVEESADLGQVGRWVCGKDTSGGVGGRWNSAKIASAFICVDGVNVVAIDDTGGGKSTEELCDDIHWESSPWELSVHTRRETDGRAETTISWASEST